MTILVSVRDDPDRPEGGYALVLLQGADAVSGDVRLLVEPLDDGVNYNGPKQIATTARRTENGVELPIGPEVVAAMPPGTAVGLTVVDTKIYVETLWPSLTPPRAVAKRKTLIQARTRSVVEPANRAAPVTQPPASGGVARPATSPPPDKPAEPPKPEAIEPPPFIPPAPPPPLPVAEDKSVVLGGEPREIQPLTKHGEVDRARTDAASEKPAVIETKIVRRGVNGAAAVAMSLVAFVIGAGLTAGLWFEMPGLLGAPIKVAEVAEADVKLPSPYEMLNTLSDRSPAGTAISQLDWRQYLEQGRKAHDPVEGAFWKAWATRSLLESQKTGAAATLSDFATGFIDSQADPHRLAAARFLWEMAAVANDCAAMDNIVASLAVSTDAEASALAKTWRDRAKKCREGKR